jgi:hypothetical protein
VFARGGSELRATADAASSCFRLRLSHKSGARGPCRFHGSIFVAIVFQNV